MNGGTRRKRLFSLWIQSLCVWGSLSQRQFDACWPLAAYLHLGDITPVYWSAFGSSASNPWSLSLRAVGGQFSVLSDQDSSGPGLCPFFCLPSDIKVEMEGLLSDHFPAARHRPCNPKSVLPLCRAGVHPAPVLERAVIAQDGRHKLLPNLPSF